MDAKVTYWVEMSDYDIATADAMQQTARYPSYKEERLPSLSTPCVL